MKRLFKAECWSAISASEKLNPTTKKCLSGVRINQNYENLRRLLFFSFSVSDPSYFGTDPDQRSHKTVGIKVFLNIFDL